MIILQKAVHSAAVTTATLFILLSLLGMWMIERWAAGIPLKGFGLVEASVGVG